MKTAVRYASSIASLVKTLVLGAACLAPSRADSYGPLGVSLKIGESAGGFGAQLAYNLSPHWQVNAGVGGASIPYLIEYGNARTDSYFLAGRYYLRHLYFATGYSHKRARIERVVGDRVYRAAASGHGAPLHIGYEFGNRRGFFFSASIGFLYVFKGGGRTLRAGNSASWTTHETVASGPSAGLSLGYYFLSPR